MDRALTACGYLAVGVMALFLLRVLVPVFTKRVGAYVSGHDGDRRMMLGEFGRGDPDWLRAEAADVWRAREPIYKALAFEQELDAMPASRRRELRPASRGVREDAALRS